MINENMVPLVSIILPTYNCANLLPRSITNILSQTYQNFELIIAGDGSTDDTEYLIQQIHDPQVRYLRHKLTVGISSVGHHKNPRVGYGIYWNRLRVLLRNYNKDNLFIVLPFVIMLEIMEFFSSLLLKN